MWLKQNEVVLEREVRDVEASRQSCTLASGAVQQADQGRRRDSL